jgi:hexosaminidase
MNPTFGKLIFDIYMKKFILILLWFVCLRAGAQLSVSGDSVHIVPEPASVHVQKGFFFLTRSATISSDAPSSGMAGLLSHALHGYLRYDIGKNQRRSSAIHMKAAIELHILTNPADSLGDEGYTLDVSAQKILLSANDPRGLFYGIQTLMQLLPPPSESPKEYQLKIPCLKIKDYPRFGYRGLMLDVSRHFFSKEFVEKYIDEMARYKFNVFHWHLTDDNGWRIEIKGLPGLTQTGAWRVPRTGAWHKFASPGEGEKATYGGFYTQDDIREVVAYARKRFITIIPEIDVPAHSLALIASYPNLSCTQVRYPVNPGSPFYKVEDNALCVANDSTWLILDRIFTQVAALFPGKYIHIGGDEAYKGFWEKCPKDQALMAREGLKNVDELQSYFVKKLEKLILSKGKKMIGWDEILEGGLAPEATVMSWRGMKGGTEAARMGHEVIMTPINSTYLSRKQGDAAVEPFAPGMLRLSDCYDFEPVPDSVDPKFVLGGQGSLWTESISNDRHAEYMTWPRAMALSEVLWSPKEKHNFKDFIGRVEKQLPYLAADDVRYSRSMYDPVISAVKGKDDSMKIRMTTQVPGLELYYSFDGSNPDNFYPEFKGTPVDIPEGATEIRVISYRDGMATGHQVNYPLDVLEKNFKKHK